MCERSDRCGAAGHEVTLQKPHVELGRTENLDVQILGRSVVALSVEDIAARFSGRGPWKKRLPPMLDMLVALGRASQHGERFGARGSA